MFLPNTPIDYCGFRPIWRRSRREMVQLLTIAGIAKNFANGYIGSWTAGVDHDFGDFKFNVVICSDGGNSSGEVYSPTVYGAGPGIAPFTQFNSPCMPPAGSARKPS